MLRTIVAIALLAVPQAQAKEPPPPGSVISVVLYPVERGIASVYGNEDGYEWTKTANGEVVDPGKLTAAHKTLPFGSVVRVTNLRNGRSVEVRITDRGPFRPGRIVDLTPAGAKALGFHGLARVEVEVLSSPPEPRRRPVGSLRRRGG